MSGYAHSVSDSHGTVDCTQVTPKTAPNNNCQKITQPTSASNISSIAIGSSVDSRYFMAYFSMLVNYRGTIS